MKKSEAIIEISGDYRNILAEHISELMFNLSKGIKITNN